MKFSKFFCYNVTQCALVNLTYFVNLFTKVFCYQVDSKGRNFLHTAIQKVDIESVLFLLSVNANVNSRTQDSQNLTALHLAVLTGSEIIVRNLVSCLVYLDVWFIKISGLFRFMIYLDVWFI